MYYHSVGFYLLFIYFFFNICIYNLYIFFVIFFFCCISKKLFRNLLYTQCGFLLITKCNIIGRHGIQIILQCNAMPFNWIFHVIQWIAIKSYEFIIKMGNKNMIIIKKMTRDKLRTHVILWTFPKMIRLIKYNILRSDSSIPISVCQVP